VPAPPFGATTTLLVPVEVKFVLLDVVHRVPLVAVNVIWPLEPKLTLRVLVLDEENVVELSVKLLRSSEPCVRIKLPVCVWLAPNCKTTFAVLKVQLMHVDPAAVTQVPVPELESKVAVSAVVGAEAPEAPPEVAAQLAVLLASQVPLPPTQKRAAIV
jgi:hypothetical protein